MRNIEAVQGLVGFRQGPCETFPFTSVKHPQKSKCHFRARKLFNCAKARPRRIQFQVRFFGLDTSNQQGGDYGGVLPSLLTIIITAASKTTLHPHTVIATPAAA